MSWELEFSSFRSFDPSVVIPNIRPLLWIRMQIYYSTKFCICNVGSTVAKKRIGHGHQKTLPSILMARKRSQSTSNRNENEEDPSIETNYLIRAGKIETGTPLVKKGKGFRIQSEKPKKPEVYRLLLEYDKDTFEQHIITFQDRYRQDKFQGVDVTVEVFDKPFYVTSIMCILITVCSNNPKRDFLLLFPTMENPTKKIGDEHRELETGSLMSCTPPETVRIQLDTIKYNTKIAPRSNGLNWLVREIESNPTNATHQSIRASMRLTWDDKIYVDCSKYNLKRLVSPDLGRTTMVDAESNTMRERFQNLLISRVTLVFPGGDSYHTLREQYASNRGSYEADKFSPWVIAQPKTVEEIKDIVNAASKCEKKIVVRSGGHQYCGFSSGDEGYIQIIMDKIRFREYDKNDPGYKKIRIFQVPAESVGNSSIKSIVDDSQWMVKILPCHTLEVISCSLADKKLTIPHGECPKVCIGGHAQTGGYGHQMRGLGLCLDYVYSFKIVIYRNGGAQELTIFRPELNTATNPAEQELNNMIYKGVLGGSPGAFGVVTEYQLLAVHDKDFKFSRSKNITSISPHISDFQKWVTRATQKLLDFTQPGKELRNGVDAFVTISSVSILWQQVCVILAELAYTGNSKSTSAEVKQFQEVLSACGTGILPDVLTRFRGMPLKERGPSEVAAFGVRKGLEEGREFLLPFKKRVHVLIGELGEAKAKLFADEFGKLSAKVMDDKDLRLIIQMSVGGGKIETNDEPKYTGIPHRDAKFGFVFDIFYSGDSAKARAVGIQEDMQKLLSEVGGFHGRVFWGSFGRENEETKMSDERVQTWYYGDSAKYEEIQLIKKAVDPKNIFTTEFTVQLPN